MERKGCQFLIFLFIWILVVSLQAYSQTTTFTFNMEGDRNERPIAMYEDEDGYYYVSAVSCDVDSMYNNCIAMVIKLDQWGNLVDSSRYFIDGKSFYIQDIRSFGEDSILLTGRSFNNEYTHCSLELYIINSNLDVLSHKRYRFPSEYEAFAPSICEGKDGEFIITGSISIEWYPIRLLNFRLTSELDSIRCYIDSSFAEVGHIVKPLNDSLYWCLTGLYAYYTILDENFKVLSKTSVPHRTNAPYGFKFDTDTSFYLAGECNDEPDDNIGILKQFDLIDTTGMIFKQWGATDTLELTAGWGALDYTNKDSIFVGGTKGFSFYLLPYPKWYFLFQTDSMLNIRWERFIGGEAYYRVEKILATSDGGCLLASAKYDYMHSTEVQTDIEVIKVNAEGLFVGDQEIYETDFAKAIVYPNPGGSTIKVRIARPFNRAVFEMYDLRGRQVLCEDITHYEQNIEVLDLEDGFYIYHIYNDEGLDEKGKWVKRVEE